MAIRLGRREGDRRFAAIAEGVEQGAAQVVARAALRGSITGILNTPVGPTGRRRANWYTSRGTPTIRFDNTNLRGNGQLATAASIGRVQAAIAGYQIGDGPIFCANSSPGILRLNRGFSRQAPQGLSRPALAAARDEFRRGGLLAPVPR